MLFCGRKRKHKFHIVQALLAVPRQVEHMIILYQKTMVS